MSMLLIYKEQIETSIMISGLMCYVKANYVNGCVDGFINSSHSTKLHRFNFLPLKKLNRKPLIIAEIKRLYWEYFPSEHSKRGPDGRHGLCLCWKLEHECDPYDHNFLDKELIYLAKIDGSRQKYIKMILLRCRKDFNEELP